MPRFLHLTVLLLLLISSYGWAQSEIIDDEIKNNIASTTGVITFLTSQESVSGGIYHIGPPINLIQNLPLSNYPTIMPIKCATMVLDGQC